ncbi:hypothetical protein D3C72_2112410 [compost metagenome]
MGEDNAAFAGVVPFREAEHHVVTVPAEDQGVHRVEEFLVAVVLAGHVDAVEPVDTAIAARDVAIETCGDEHGTTGEMRFHRYCTFAARGGFIHS